MKFGDNHGNDIFFSFFFSVESSVGTIFVLYVNVNPHTCTLEILEWICRKLVYIFHTKWEWYALAITFTRSNTETQIEIYISYGWK